MEGDGVDLSLTCVFYMGDGVEGVDVLAKEPCKKKGKGSSLETTVTTHDMRTIEFGTVVARKSK